MQGAFGPKPVTPPGRVASEGDVLNQVLANLDCLRRGLESTFRVLLPMPEFDSVRSVKSFCSEGLDSSSRGHLWRGALCRQPGSTRLSVLGSLFLFRKTLPSSAPSVSEFLLRAGTPAPPPPDGFMRFVSDQIRHMFRVGWDSGYVKKVWSTSLTTSSCKERGRVGGGARGLAIQDSESRADFCKSALGVYPPVVDRKYRLMEACCDGKVRLVTVASCRNSVLRPLHTLLYDHLSSLPWLLRGEAEPCRFLGFDRVDGEVFVSGDYESATDCLNLDVSKHILACVLRRCSHVPIAVREAALSSLDGVLLHRGKEYRQERGTLMGSLLSFPILCLTNYLAFRFFVRREVPVRINGDDIVFRCRPAEYRQWAAGVGSTGLRLSVGKTMVRQSYFSLNSTFFRALRSGCRFVPVVRSTHLFKAVECPSAIAGRVNSFLQGASWRKKGGFVVVLLSRLRKAIFATQRSVVRGLGCRVPRWVLKAAGLWEREVFYLSLPREAVLPVPRALFAQNAVPDGWRRVEVAVKSPGDEELERLFFEEMVALTWERPPLPVRSVSGTIWERTRDDSFSCAEWLDRRCNVVDRSRLLRVSVRTCRSYLRCVLESHVQRKWFSSRATKRCLVWRPSDARV
nr:MAG: putative RNA-dependent RNA polymerase [Botourmiaviridae sp.]